MADAATIDVQIRQYEEQLAEIDELIKATPEDGTLVSLKNDLVELISITRQQRDDTLPVEKVNPLEKALEAAVETSVGASSTVQEKKVNTEEESSDKKRSSDDILQEEAQATGDSKQRKKKSKTLKEFVVPDHLVINDTDSDAQKNKKRREIKSLKSKWRAREKEIQSERKQQSWQSFQKKKGKRKDKSIFSTSEDGGKVGVIRGS